MRYAHSGCDSHYFGPSHPENNLPAIGSYIEPLGRVAALSEAIVALHQNFGPNRHIYDGTAIEADASSPPRQVDIVILAVRGHELTGELGLDPGVIEIRYVDCKPPWIGFEAQRVFRERLGRYDFYCFMEDDLIIHDPAFFDKLAWFQKNFGYKSLLMPVRCEIPATGTPAKVIADLDLIEPSYRPFRRPGQREKIEAIWNGQLQSFVLPKNPHAGSFFLTGDQMDYWVKQPTYDDKDASWTGPLESAATFSVGRVFDIYKPQQPDPLFLEVHHFGVRYASQYPPEGRRYGEPPLLAIAQNALRAALDPGNIHEIGEDSNGPTGPSFPRLVRHWIAQGSAVELRGQLDVLQTLLNDRTQDAVRLQQQLGDQNETQRIRLEELARVHEQYGELSGHAEQLRQQLNTLTGQSIRRNEEFEQHHDQLAAQINTLQQEAAKERFIRSHSLRWLLGSLRAELLRRLLRRGEG